MQMLGGVHKKTARYWARKANENVELLDDVCRLLRISALEGLTLLALDDVDEEGHPHTMRHWVKAGGRAGNVHVANPDDGVVQAVRRAGGHAHRGWLQEMLEVTVLPRFDVVYADFCGFFSVQGSSLRTLLVDHERLLVPLRTVLCLTTSLREGSDVPYKVILPQLQQWAAEAGYGQVYLYRAYQTETMHKTTLLLERASSFINMGGRAPEWHVGQVLYQRLATWGGNTNPDDRWVEGRILAIRPRYKKEQVLIRWPVLDCVTHHRLDRAPWTEGAMAVLPPGAIVFKG